MFRTQSCLLVFALFGAAGCGSDREARIAAASSALEHSIHLQHVLANERQCPTRLDGWEPDADRRDGTLRTRAGNAYVLSLECEQDKQQFSVTVHYSFDDHVYVSGSFDGPLELTYGHFTATKSAIVPSQPNIRALAELLAYGN